MMNEGSLPELPGGWVWTRLGEICELINGRAFKPEEWATQGIPIIRIQNLNNINTDFNYCNFELEEKYIVNNGQLLFAWSGTPGTSFGAHIWNRGRAVLNQHIFKIGINENLINKIFFMYLINHNIDEYIGKAHGTAGLAHITKNKFENSVISIPSFPEQRAIVSKIEQLFSDLDNGIENFRKAQAQLKLYRQSVLKAACEGKLVPTEAELARAEGRDYEAADVLLARILKERRKKWNGKGKYKEVVAPDTNDLSKLPEGWYIAFFEQIAEINPKSSNNGLTDNTEVSFLPMKVVEEQTGRYDLSIIKNYSEVKKGYTSFINGDIIFAKITPCMENGKIAVVENLKNGIGFGSTEFHVIRFSGNDISRTYIFNFIVQENFRRDAKRSMTGSAGQLRVPTNYLRQTLIPLPPLAEQRRIVAEVERRLSVSDKMEATITESLQKAESLRQSILKKAFEGKLLNERELEKARNASDWEPAEKLLERIKAEKIKAQKNTRRSEE